MSRARVYGAGASATGRFLDPKVLARISNLELLARTTVEGFISGLHRSPYLGRSLDFAEHRPYMPGDDIRKIDWRVYARTDRYYLKEFEADTNTNCTIALDISRSMSFGKDGLSKFDYGRFLAACLAYFAHKQRDRIGLVTFDHEVVDWIPPSAKHLEAILHTIDRTRCERLGSLRPPLMRLASRTRRSSIVIVISDFYENPEDVVRTIGLLRGQGNDVIVFHVLDDAEVSFSFDQDAEFEDLETGDRMALSPGAAREDYARRIAEHIDRLRQMLTEGGVDYSLLTTSMPLDFGLFSYLSSRQKAARVR